MATTIRKRKLAVPLESSRKKLQIEASVPKFELAENFDDDDYEDGSYQDENDFSDTHDCQTVDTPLTPISPGRKKFPSMLKTLECTYAGCDKTFNRPSRLATHLRSHANEKPFVCSEEGCGKAYTDAKHLKQHIKSSHSQERPYACEWDGCEKSFLTGTRLRRHQKVHEGENRFRCTAYPPCNETFRKHQTLERHIRSSHLELTPFPCTYIDPITMELCNAGFDGSGGLRRHQERVHGILQFFCIECTVPDSYNLDGSPIHIGFTTESQLQLHIKKDHVNCPFCDRKISSKRELDKHVESQHSGTTLEQRKSILCTYAGCTSSFSKKSNLDAHIRSAHEGQRFICGTFDISKTQDLIPWQNSDGCGRDFVSKANLEDHVRTAHLARPSLINRNRKKSNNKSEAEGLDMAAAPKNKRGRKSKPSDLDQLLGTTYENDERRTFHCFMADCPRKFIRDFDLRRHLRSKHRLSTPEIDEFNGVSFAEMDTGSQPAYIKSEEPFEETMDNQGRSSWEMQADNEADNTPFWIGAEDGMGREDQWMDDEMEMRRLIDETDMGGRKR